MFLLKKGVNACFIITDDYNYKYGGPQEPTSATAKLINSRQDLLIHGRFIIQLMDYIVLYGVPQQ